MLDQLSEAQRFHRLCPKCPHCGLPVERIESYRGLPESYWVVNAYCRCAGIARLTHQVRIHFEELERRIAQDDVTDWIMVQLSKAVIGAKPARQDGVRLIEVD